MSEPATSGPCNLAVAASGHELVEQARQLAARLGLSLLPRPSQELAANLLLLTRRGLEMHQLGPGAPGPVYVDLLGGPMGYRRRHGGGLKQALAKAAGLKKGGRRPTVIDATAGLGRDAFILAELGCRVRLIERCPAIHALLADGLQRGAAADAAVAAIISQRISLVLGDAVDLLSQATFPAAEVIYLDPMFPGRDKSSLVKKEMRLLRQVAGHDPDADRLLAAALSRAELRVVVKRPRAAPPLQSSRPPSFSLTGKSSRFDIYLLTAAGRESR